LTADEYLTGQPVKAIEGVRAQPRLLNLTRQLMTY